MTPNVAIANPERRETLERLLRGRLNVVDAEQSPDGLVVVHEPPETDGFAALRRLGGPRPPTVWICDASHRREALGAGAAEVVRLDRLDADVLADAVQSAIDRSAASAVDATERKVVEHLRVRAQDLLQGVTDTIPDLIYAKDLEGRMVLANPATVRAVGRPHEELIGRRDEDWLGDLEEARAIRRNDLRVMESGRSERLEEHVTTLDGQHRLYQSLKSPLRDAGGRVVGLVGVSRDITEQKAVERDLVESERRAREALSAAERQRTLLDVVLDAAPAGIILHDVNANPVRSNAASWECWGLERLEDHPDRYAERIGLWPEGSPRHGERLRPEEWAVARALRGEIVRQEVIEIEPFDRPGTRRTVVDSAAPVRDADGKIIGAVVAKMDLTRLVAAERAGRESEAKFQAIADNIPPLAWIADPDGKITWYNQRWFEYTGTTPEDMQGWGSQAVQHPDHVARVAAKFHAHLKSGEPWEDTFPLRGADGAYRWFLSRARAIRDDRGKITWWFGTNTDVTDQREAEEKLRDADRRKSEFISMLAHELRNPLSSVRNAVDVLHVAEPSSQAADRARDVIDRQVAHMARLVGDLLDVALIENGQVALRSERVDLAAVARQAAEDSRESMDGAGIALRVDAPGPLPVDGDPVRLAQMVGNLLHNASRFTERGGRVTVTARVAGDWAEVEIADTGVGIAADVLARLFDPFQQAEQGLARSKGGLGLGLSLTRWLATLHHGDVRASSPGLGEGSRFTIRLPLASGPAPALAPRLDDPAHGKLRVLVVDDNRDAAETLRDLLELGGHEADVAFDGEEALEKLRARPPEVVVSDIGLPGDLDGYALARAVRADDRLADVRLVALSGYADPDSRTRAKDAGFDAHLVKPPDIGALLAALEPPPAG